MFNLEARRLERDLIYLYKCLMRGKKKNRARHFSVVPTNRTRGIRHKLKHMKSGLIDIMLSEPTSGKVISKYALDEQPQV